MPVSLLTRCESTPLGATCFIDRSVNEDRVLLTFASSCVQIYNPSSLECLQSWTVRPGTSLSVPAFQIPSSQRFVSVVDGIKLVSWGTEHACVEDGTSEKLPNAAQSAFSVGDSICIVSCAGQAQLLSADLEPISEWTDSVPGFERVLFSGCSVTTTSKQSVIYTVVKAEDRVFVVLLVCNIEASTICKVVTHELVHPSDPTSSLVPSSLDFDIASRSLCVSWCDGVIALLQFEEAVPLVDAVSQSPKLRIKRRLGHLHEDSPIRCGFVDSIGHILVAGHCRLDVPALSFWSSQFGVVVRTEDLEVDERDGKIENRRLRKKPRSRKATQMAPVLSINPLPYTNGVVVVYSNLVWVCDLQLAVPSLANCIGKLSQTADWLHPEDQKMVNPEVDDKTAVVNQILEHAVFSKPSKTSAKFKKQFESLWELLLTNSKSELPSIPQPVVAKALQTCLSHKHTEGLLRIIRCGCVSAQDCLDLVPALIKGKNAAALRVCVEYIADFQEVDLVRTLQFCLSDQRLSEEALQKSLASPDAILECPMHQLMFQTLKSQKNDAFLQPALACLSPEHVAVGTSHHVSIRTISNVITQTLGNYILNLLQLMCKQGGPMSLSSFPAPRHLANWAGLLLDSHVVDFLKHKRCSAIVGQLYAIVSKQSQLCQADQSLYGFLSQLIHTRKSGGPCNPIGAYRLEELSW